MDKQYLYAWAAGLLDADGTITIKRQKRYEQWYFVQLIQVTQVATFKGKANIKRLQELFGGNVKETTMIGGGLKKAVTPVIGWQVTSQRAAECARLILPFMTGK